MKNFTKISIIAMVLMAIGLIAQSQTRDSKAKSGQTIVHEQVEAGSFTANYAQGGITIKLKKGVGDFGKQTGTVKFGIQSLDDKAALFEVYQLEKRFRYNPLKLRDDLPDLSRIYKISLPGKFSMREVAETFSSDPNVEYAEAIPVYSLAEVPNDPLYSQLKHLPQIFAPHAWDIHKGQNGSDDIVLAINDSGVDWDHVDLQSNIWQNLAEDADNDGHTMEYQSHQWVLDPGDLNGIDNDGNGFTDDLIGWNFLSDNNDPNPVPNIPANGHGSHCAGIAAGVTNNGTGIASISWNLKIMNICAGPMGGISHGNDGIIYAAENGADFISNSWGGPAFSYANEEVVNYATGLGSVVLACAHNYNNTELIYPAAYPGVISVAAVDVDDTKTPYSNYNFAVDISAPGGIQENGILSTIPGNNYDLYFGTSMATPMVAGCLGLLKSYHPGWTNDQLITQLLGTADHIDSLNQKFANMLGSGRVNAYRMLSEENVTPFLKLELISFTPADANANSINQPGETVTLNFDLHNYMQTYGAQNVNVSISASDPEIIITNGSCIINIPPDSSFSIINQLQIKVKPNASPHFAELTLHFDADIPIVMGQDINFKLLIAPSGIFVFEGEEDGPDHSGKFIAGFLDHLGYNYTYSNSLTSLLGFETAFLSFGNPGQNMDRGTPFSEDNSLAIQQFMEEGGKLYIEMGGMFYKMNSAQFQNTFVMKQLFGINSVQYSTVDNPIDTLLGVTGSPAEGIIFTGSDQLHNWYIDKLTPVTSAKTPFYEQDFGNVAIMNNGTATHGQKTFYMGYSLADLHDRDAVSSRYNVLVKTMEFFGYTLPQGYVLSNFIADKTAGGLPLQVAFTDISLNDTAFPVTSWQWDFDNNGTIDSYDQNPVWTYYETGSFDVKLITSNGSAMDTLVINKLINVNSGYLVYEGVPGGADYSGTFIRDYLQENAYTVTYRNSLPESLEGFSAVFLSYGNYASGGTRFDDRMANTVKEYLESGGYVYLEGGDALGCDQANNEQLLSLFALDDVQDGITNPIDELKGREVTVTEGMVFNGNSQVSNSYIDKYQQDSPNGRFAFTEGYSKVAVQQNIPGGRRSFCFSYALSCLTDGVFPSTRVELLNRILNFFNIYVGSHEAENYSTFKCNIYPNPCTNNLTISALNKFQINEALIYNLTGQKVLQRKPVNNTLDISNLQPGMYIIELVTDQGNMREKLIVE